MMASMAFLAMLGLSVALVAGFFGTLHPAFDSFSHFRVHLAVLMALFALPLLATSFRLQAAAALVFAVAAFATTSNALPRLWQVQAAYVGKPADQPIYRLLQMNLRYDNPTPKKVLSLIGRINPDVITLDEVSEMWTTELGYITSAYPYRILCPYPNGVFGVALLSRRPFVAGSESWCERRGAMAIAKVDFGGTTVEVAAIHLSWPWPSGTVMADRRVVTATLLARRDGDHGWRLQRRAVERGRAARRSTRRADSDALGRAELDPSPVAGLPATLRRAADRSGLQQGCRRHPFGVEAGGHRLRPSSDHGRVLAAAR